MKVHPVFHVELLREYKGDDFTPPPLIVCEDGTMLWEIERLLDERGEGAKRQYLVRWKGFGPEHDTWEPRKQLMLDSPDSVSGFEQWQADMRSQLSKRPRNR